MRTNNVITKMRAGEKAYGCSLTFPSSAVVELMGQAGLDHVSFDSEHGPFTPESLDDLCRVDGISRTLAELIHAELASGDS